MGVTAIPFIVTLCCVCLTNAYFGKTFVVYKGYGPVATSVAVTIPSSSRPLSCHSACLRRNSCLAFSMSSSTCILYDTYMDAPVSQLQTQTGQVFFNFAMEEKVSVTAEDASKQNGGWANFYPQQRINKAGRVLSWQVRCGSAGVVLAIWWGEITLPITFIGKHYTEIPDGMQNQLVTYDAPVEETVLVEAGDFLGFHYDDNEPEARVKLLNAEETPEGVPISNMYSKNIHDSDVPVGTTIALETGANRTPCLAVYIS